MHSALVTGFLGEKVPSSYPPMTPDATTLSTESAAHGDTLLRSFIVMLCALFSNLYMLLSIAAACSLVTGRFGLKVPSGNPPAYPAFTADLISAYAQCELLRSLNSVFSCSVNPLILFIMAANSALEIFAPGLKVPSGNPPV